MKPTLFRRSIERHFCPTTVSKTGSLLFLPGERPPADRFLAPQWQSRDASLDTMEYPEYTARLNIRQGGFLRRVRYRSGSSATTVIVMYPCAKRATFEQSGSLPVRHRRFQWPR